eukprot:661126-Karenia_brevis.AAC.1
MHICRLGIRVFVTRVKSADNIADLPSRGERGSAFLREQGALEVDAHIHSAYWRKDCWAILQDRWII